MRVHPAEVHGALKRSILVEGYPFVLDLEKSHGQYLHDAVSGRDYLDFFTFYASRPLRFDHPGLFDAEFERDLLRASRLKPSNGDVYTELFAEFVETFRARVMGKEMRHLFFVDGGSLGVENALKAAFDWKVQKNLERGRGERGTHVLHFTQAFHGRSGYALTLTNTDPKKTKYFPRFDWPRVSSPAMSFPCTGDRLAAVEEAEQHTLAELDAVYARLGQDEIACLIVEPIQCEGGDRHLRPAFLQRLRDLCDERETLLIFDEVQTGMGSTGTWWYYQQLGVAPDLVSFAKKAQTGGFMCSGRIDDVDNVFKVKSRISSTFSGNLTDYVRSRRIVEIVEAEGLLDNARQVGAYLVEKLLGLAGRHERVTNVRGAGTIIAFDLPDGTLRDKAITRALHEGLIVLPCGERSVRLRPALDVTRTDADQAIDLLDRALVAVSG